MSFFHFVLSKRPFVVDIREELLIVLSGGLDRRRRHGGRHQQVHDDRVELHDQEHEQGDARGRLELKQEARASRTLRRYGYCEADSWSVEEWSAADALIGGLKDTANAQRERLRVLEKHV